MGAAHVPADLERPVTLKLFRGSDGPQEPPGLSPQLRLSEFYAAFFRPVYLLRELGAAAKTLADYDAAVALWSMLTGDPPLSAIDSATCARFEELAEKTPGKKPGTNRSPQTVRKQVAYLQMIFNLAGPRTRRYRTAPTAKGLFGRDLEGDLRPVPVFPRVMLPETQPKGCYSLAQVEAWIRATASATRPKPFAARWHETLIRFLWATDCRIGSALALRRAWIQRLPAGDGVIQFPRSAYKHGRRRKAGPILIYLSPPAMAAIDRAPGPDVCWPWTHSANHLHKTRREIQTAAGLPESVQEYGYHGLRRAGLTELYQRDPEAARLQAGHRDLSTTVDHYVQRQVLGEALAKQMRPAHAGVRQPKDDRQRLLF